MRLDELVQFITLTIGLTIGVAVSATTAFRANISANWDENRCSPGVVPIASFFKPSTDPRTPSQFARDNWSFCQKQYVQGALKAAAAAPQELVNASEASVGLIQNVAGDVADVFYNLWNFIYQAYSTFMDKMNGAAKLFHNFMINLHSIVDRLQAAVLSIVFGLMSLIAAFVSSVQVVLIVAIVIIGILIALQVLLFFVLLPIAPLIISMTALVSVVVIAVATAIAAAVVAETFTPGVCFTGDTQVVMADSQVKRMDTIRIGDLLEGDSRVTAVHRFKSNDDVYDLYGIRVTGDHLVRDPVRPDTWMAVRDHPAATREDVSVGTWFHGGTDLWCLTTTKRTIPCLTPTGATLIFADWEEIPEEDEAGRVAWYGDVWRHLNGSAGPMRPPIARALNSEAGFSPDCKIACRGWMGGRVWRRIMDVKIGDTVWINDTETTTVVGHVVIAGDQCTDAVVIPGGEGALTTCGTWFWQSGQWNPATAFQIQELHPSRWHHLYTTAGSFVVAGGHMVRDASDVGLGELKPLVEEIVLGRQQKPILC